jgi:hypothetical protein
LLRPCAYWLQPALLRRLEETTQALAHREEGEAQRKRPRLAGGAGGFAGSGAEICHVGKFGCGVVRARYRHAVTPLAARNIKNLIVIYSNIQPTICLPGYAGLCGIQFR